jgi:hypothetical protein
MHTGGELHILELGERVEGDARWQMPCPRTEGAQTLMLRVGFRGRRTVSRGALAAVGRPGSGGVRRPTVSASAPPFLAAGRRYRQPEPPGPDQRSAIRKADAVLPAFARVGPRHDTLKRASRSEAGVVCYF